MDYPLRSLRHSQADDDLHRPDASQHVFDAPGLRTPVTDREGAEINMSSSRAPSSQEAPLESQNPPAASGQNVPAAAVNAALEHREPDDNPAVWLDQDFQDEEDIRPFDERLTVND